MSFVVRKEMLRMKDFLFDLQRFDNITNNDKNISVSGSANADLTENYD